MLKFAEVANVADIIKAYDFKPMEGREDSYLIGRVIAKGAIKHPEYNVVMFHGYTVEIIDSRSGDEGYDEKRRGDIGYIPFEVDFLEYDERVSLFASEEEMMSVEV